MLADRLLPLLGAAGLFLLPGWPLVRAMPAKAGLPLYGQLAVAYLLGVAWMGATLFALSLLGIPLRLPAVAAMAASPALGVACRRLVGRGRRRAEGSPPGDGVERPSRAQVAVVGLAAVLTLGLFAQAWSAPLIDWDGRMTWATNARYMRADATVLPRAFIEPGWEITDEWYPPLLPLAQVALLETVRAPADGEQFRGLYLLFYPVWLALVHVAARRWSTAAGATLTLAVAALLPLPAFSQFGGAGSAYSDLPLACMLAAGLLLLGPEPLAASRAVAGGLLLAGAALSKVEGLPLAILMLAATAAVPAVRTAGDRRWPLRLRARWRQLVLASLLVAAAAGLLGAWRSAGWAGRQAEAAELIAQSEFTPSNAFEVSGTAGLRQLPARFVQLATKPGQLQAIFAAVRFQTLSIAHWGIFWLAWPLVLIGGARALRRWDAVPLWALGFGPPLLGLLAYTVAARPANLVSETWGRFLLQASIGWLTLFAMAAGDLLDWLRAARLARRRTGAGPPGVVAGGLLALAFATTAAGCRPPAAPIPATRPPVVDSLDEHRRSVAADADAALVDLAQAAPGVRLDMRYATSDNFLHRQLYPTGARAFLRRPAAEALAAAQRELAAEGLGLKVWDAYRPYAVTVAMWEPIRNPDFVADPAKGSRHNRGCAVDATLVRLSDGSELAMPTAHDDFTPRAASDYAELPAEVLANRQKLRDVLARHGFVQLPSEWWHFDFAGWERFPLLDLPLDELP